MLREYYRLKYNDLVLDIHDKFPSKFPGEKWPNDIDIDKLIQLKNLMVPVTTKIETKDFIGALKDLNKKKKGLEEPWPELFYETANVYSIQKNYKKAMNDIDQAIALDPNYVDAYLLRGDIQLLADNTYEASVDYKYANRIDPNNISPNIKLANLYKRENKYDEAIDILIEAQKIDPTNPELPYQMGIIYMSKKYDDKPTPDIEKAREKFGNAIDLGNNEQNKPHASAYFELGKIKLTDGDFESASDDFKIARNIGLNNKQLDYLKEECEKQYFKGKKQVYYFKDNWHGIELFTNAINIYDELAAVWFQRGKAYYIEKKYDLAKIDFEKSIELYEEWDSAHYFLGMCLVSLDQNNDAIKQFDKASLYSSGKRMPVAEMGQGIAKYNLAQLVDVSDKETEKEFFGLLNDAGTHFASYLQLEDNALARFYYGQCLYQYTKYKEATVQFELAIKLDPGYGEAYYWKVRAMESKGGVKSAKAVEDLKFAVTNGFDSDTLYNKLAEYQTMDENDLKGAIRSYTKSLEYNKKQPLVYKERSAINARLGYYNNAAFDLLQAIKVDPTFGSFKIYATISRFYLRDKNLDSCILFADKSNALEENSDAFYSKACALMDKGERMLGLETLENALKLEDIPLDKIKKSSYFKDVVNTSEFKTLVNKYYSK
ncbi:MAG: tetratricopeptide repeat protein [Chitinophagales bacterium]